MVFSQRLTCLSLNDLPSLAAKGEAPDFREPHRQWTLGGSASNHGSFRVFFGFGHRQRSPTANETLSWSSELAVNAKSKASFRPICN